MTIELINFFERYFPQTKKGFARSLYNFLAWRFPVPEWRFMNYGYDEGNANLSLLPEDEANRYFIGMYAAAIEGLELHDRDILEVGSGRGGGSEWMARTGELRSMTGLDLSENAIDLCRQMYRQPNLKYVQGDAQNLPFDDGEFDIVLNVESCHHYPSVSQFITEVTRVLKPGGYFCIADYGSSSQVREMQALLENCALELLEFKDITANVVRALDRTEPLKVDLIQRYVPRFLTNPVRTFAAAEGSEMYNLFVENRLPYFMARLKKP